MSDSTSTSLSSPSNSSTWFEKIKDIVPSINLSVGFLGIQFAWAIQMGQMSPLLERLGSEPWLTSMIWAAGPVTGVLVQPIVGTLSDKHRSALGRRRPFLIFGAIMTAISLVLMPNSALLGDFFASISPIGLTFPVGLLVAALLLWVLDASINITQGPYRAMVPDVIEKKQQTTAYALTSLTIGLGAVAAFFIAYTIADVHFLFYLGAIAMLFTMGWTVMHCPEPSTLNSDDDTGSEKAESILSVLGSTFRSIGEMPKEGLQLCFAHSFTWFGLMCLFVFFSVFVPKHIFGAVGATTPLYEEGVRWASLCFCMMNLVCFVVSPLIAPLCDKFSKKGVHSFSLLTMAISFVALFFMNSPLQALIAMGVIGIGWATTLSVPFALLTEHLPKGKEGVLMGTFNIFIAAPGVLCSFLVGPIISMSGGNEGLAFFIGGASILLSVILLQGVVEEPTEELLETK